MPRWLNIALAIAGIYNLAWGAAVVLFPQWSYRIGGLDGPDSPLVNTPLWQCIGMIVGVYGIGYLIASRDPARHWPIVLVGLLGKIFGPIGCIKAASLGELPWSTALTNLFNDVIWWLPFGLILWHAHRAHQAHVTRSAEELAASH